MFRRSSMMARYAFTILVVTLATLLRFALIPVLNLEVPFIIHYPTVVLCAWFGGLGPGLLSTAFGGMVVWYIFIPPQYSLTVSDPTAPAQLVIFSLAGTLISWLAESLHRARRKTEESEIREREQREQFRVTLASIGDAVIATDARGQVTFMNPVAESLTGWKREEASGRRLEEVFHIVNAQTRQPVENPALRAMREGMITGLANHTVLIAKDGTERPIDDSGAPIKNSEGKMLGSVLIFRDMTERNRAEEALRQSEEALRRQKNQFTTLVEHIPDIVARLDRDLRFLYISPVVVRATGQPPEEYIGKTRTNAGIPAEFASAREELSRKVFETGQPYTLEFPIETPSGERYFETRLIPEFAPDGSVESLMTLTRDITDRKRAEEERAHLLDREQAARAEAEAANRAKDEFLAMVSHELRTPLTPILGWAHLLSIGNLDAKETRQAIETIERNAKTQSQLIEDLLDMSRIISGKMRLNFEPVDLVQTIENGLEIVQPAAQAKMIQLRTDLDAESGTVMGDETRLQQVVWNLLSNAVKFTPKGGRVEIRLERTDSEAQIVVSDTGQGIRPEFLPHVFERFQQAESKDTRQQGGLGLGLAIVRHLVEMHGGTVKADSPGVGQGATFTLRFPLRAVQTEISEMRGEQAAESRRLLDRLSPLDGMKVLVVDDEASAREIITAILTRCGATVTAVASAADAITTLAQTLPDVLISDIGMPDENGYELIRQVRRLKPEQGGNIPAVALTAYAKTEDRMRALSAGFQTHVPKPVQPSELALVVARLVERTKTAEQSE